MKASEMRAIALKAKNDGHDKQYSKISSDIQKAASVGKFEIFIYDPLLQSVTEQLQNEDFRIVNAGYDGRNEYSATITWK